MYLFTQIQHRTTLCHILPPYVSSCDVILLMINWSLLIASRSSCRFLCESFHPIPVLPYLDVTLSNPNILLFLRANRFWFTLVQLACFHSVLSAMNESVDPVISVSSPPSHEMMRWWSTLSLHLCLNCSLMTTYTCPPFVLWIDPLHAHSIWFPPFFLWVFIHLSFSHPWMRCTGSVLHSLIHFLHFPSLCCHSFSLRSFNIFIGSLGYLLSLPLAS